MATLKRVHLFDRSLCAVDEGAGTEEMAQPLLFTWPDEDLADRLRHFSFAQGMIDFARAFSEPDDPLQVWGSASETAIVHKCEDDVWCVLSVELDGAQAPEAQHPPLKALCKSIATHVTLFCRSVRAVIDEATMEDPASDSGSRALVRVVDRLRHVRAKLRSVNALEAALAAGDRVKEAHHDAKLASKPMLEQELISLTARSPLPRLKKQLRFIVLELIREFTDERCFDHPHLFHSLGDFGGFHFCPCDRLTYLSVQYFVSTLRFRFKQIERCAMLFDGRIVWSCIPVAQMRSVYTYLRTRSMRKAVEDAARFSQPFVHDVDGELFARFVYDDAEEAAKTAAAARAAAKAAERASARRRGVVFEPQTLAAAEAREGEGAEGDDDIGSDDEASRRDSVAVAAVAAAAAAEAEAEAAEALAASAALRRGHVMTVCQHKRISLVLLFHPDGLGRADAGRRESSAVIGLEESGVAAEEGEDEVTSSEGRGDQLTAAASLESRASKRRRGVDLFRPRLDALAPVCAEILAFVRPELTKCSAAIGQQYDRVVQSIKESESLASGSRPFRFIYFNTTNYAVKTSGFTRSKRQEAAAAAKEEKELAKKEKLAAAAAASSSSGGGDGESSGVNAKQSIFSIPPKNSTAFPQSAAAMSRLIASKEMNLVDVAHSFFTSRDETAVDKRVREEIGETRLPRPGGEAVAASESGLGRSLGAAAAAGGLRRGGADVVSAGRYCESYTKTEHLWVIAIHSGTRQLFVLLDRRVQSLEEAQAIVTKLCARYFHNVYLNQL